MSLEPQSSDLEHDLGQVWWSHAGCPAFAVHRVNVEMVRRCPYCGSYIEAYGTKRGPRLESPVASRVGFMGRRSVRSIMSEKPMHIASEALQLFNRLQALPRDLALEEIEAAIGYDKTIQRLSLPILGRMHFPSWELVGVAIAGDRNEVAALERLAAAERRHGRETRIVADQWPDMPLRLCLFIPRKTPLKVLEQH